MQLTDVTIAAETEADDNAILALHREAFGPGRFARAAERIREGAGHDLALSRTACRGGTLIGSVRMTPVVVDGVAGHMLGPMAVTPHAKRHGVGGELLRQCCRAAFGSGSEFVVLVGDEPYYGRHGFARADGPVMPGPVDPARLLVRWPDGPRALRGAIRPFSGTTSSTGS